MSTQMIIEQDAPPVPVVVNESQSILAVIERAARDNTVDIDKMQKLLDMHERVLERNARLAFNADLAAMQHEIPSIAENGAITVQKEVRSKYATFEDINDAVKPILQKYGFAISFRIKQLEAQIEVTAVLSHKEGHSEETSMRMPSDTSGSKNAVQAMGSTVSYGKRYTMMAMLNITSREKSDRDDDGEGTSEFIELDEAAEIDMRIIEFKEPDYKTKFLQYMKVDDVRKILKKDLAKAKTALDAKAKKKAEGKV